MMQIKYPGSFLEVRVQILDLLPHATSLCAGYEGRKWRAEQLSDHLFQWLPYVALSQELQLSMDSSNFVELLKQAAAHIYKTKKTDSRGEIGELLLHLACIINFNSFPVICKLILKSSSNDTVKGFDGVHLVKNGNDYELWLGESKFYKDPRAAIRDAVKSIKDHILPEFLATEKAMIIGHVGKDVPNRDDVIRLFKSHTSSDELIAKAVFPVMIAYESDAVKTHSELTKEYEAMLEEETRDLDKYFMDQTSDLKIRFHLIFLPMSKKADLLESFDKKLEAFV